MRSWASSALSAGALLAFAAPASAAPVDEFADAAVRLRQSVQAAAPRAKAAAQRRREGALGCLDLLGTVPERNRTAVYNAYFVDVAGGLYSVDGPLIARFVGRLERIRLRREPALMAARRILRAEIAGVEALVLSIDDVCTVAREWQAARWRTPPRSVRVVRRLLRLSESIPQETDAAEARLRRAGHPRAARYLANPLPGGDDLVEVDGDPVRCALQPESLCP